MKSITNSHYSFQSSKFNEWLDNHLKTLNNPIFFLLGDDGECTGIVLEHARDDGRPRFLYSEVTGYAIMDMLLTASITGDKKLVDRAIQAGSWLAGLENRVGNALSAWENGWIRCRYYFENDHLSHLDDSFSSQNIFTFDCAIALISLIQLWRRTLNNELWNRIIQLGDNLCSLVASDGKIPAVVNVHNSIPEPKPENNARWSRHSGPFHAKIAETLAELWSACTEFKKEAQNKHDTYANTAHKICSYTLAQQLDSGRFLTSFQSGVGLTELHPHMYAAEGLFKTGELLQIPRFIHAAQKATTWALDRFSTSTPHKLIDQSYSSNISSASPRYRVDAVAQVVRLASQLEQREILEPEFAEIVDEIASALFDLQRSDGSAYFEYGYYEDGRHASNVVFWTQYFCFEAQLAYLSACCSRMEAPPIFNIYLLQRAPLRQ